MLMDLTPRPLTEPISGRHWDRAAVLERYRRRLAFYARRGLGRGDRVLFHHGNTPEFFIDLLAVWSLGGCAVPIDARLTPFEIASLAHVAVPRLSLWLGEPDAETARSVCYHLVRSEISADHSGLGDLFFLGGW